jgi:hypothetical protein
MQIANITQEVNSRWRLVETALNLGIAGWGQVKILKSLHALRAFRYAPFPPVNPKKPLLIKYFFLVGVITKSASLHTA